MPATHDNGGYGHHPSLALETPGNRRLPDAPLRGKRGRIRGRLIGKTPSFQVARSGFESQPRNPRAERIEHRVKQRSGEIAVLCARKGPRTDDNGRGHGTGGNAPMHRNILLTSACGLVAILLAFSALGAPSAEARYLPYGKAYRAVVLDVLNTKHRLDANQSEVRVGHRVLPSRLEFPAAVAGDELIEIIPGHSTPGGGYEPHRSIYEHFFCQWTAVAHWSGRLILVARRGIDCEEWIDESP